jgi:hypothetical protein
MTTFSEARSSPARNYLADSRAGKVSGLCPDQAVRSAEVSQRLRGDVTERLRLPEAAEPRGRWR